MKFLIASDLHGSSTDCEKLIQRFNAEKADKLILLGDVYNHGPRNPLPDGYQTMKVAQLLNGIKQNLIVVKGNCDSQVDTMISEFSFVEDVVLVSANKTVFLTHGHVFNENNMPAADFDAIIYGHFHTGFIKKRGEKLIANTGSVSLPKNNTPKSYILLNDGVVILKDLNGELIKEEKI